MKRETLKTIWQMGWKITLGSAIFALGFDLFLEPNNLNVGQHERSGEWSCASFWASDRSA